LSILSPAQWIASYQPYPYQLIVGTDTDVGKTWVTGHLLKGLTERGVTVTTQKWVQTGDQFDIDTHDHIANVTGDPTWRADRMPYQFTPPVSPHYAAALAHRSIEWPVIESAMTRLQANAPVIIEGSGGVMVPWGVGETMLDHIAGRHLVCVVVGPNRVGVLNHLHLTMLALESRGIEVMAMVLNEGCAVARDTEWDIQASNVSYCDHVWGATCPIIPWPRGAVLSSPTPPGTRGSPRAG